MSSVLQIKKNKNKKKMKPALWPVNVFPLATIKYKERGRRKKEKQNKTSVEQKLRGKSF